MISALISRLVILVCATLYPAYCSYKAVKTKDIKLYVKWMMYWIVFALFTSIETFTDIFVSFWCPFYYEFKILFVLWLLLPIFKGSNYLYRKVIHPYLSQKEQDIDEMIARAKDQGCSVLMDIGSKGVTLATNVIMNTAVKNTASIGLIPAPPLKPQQPVTAEAADQTDAVMITDTDDTLSLNDLDEFRPPRERKRTRRTSKRSGSTSRSRSRVTRSRKKQLTPDDDPDWEA